jgi:hypothetical protein
MTNKNLDTTNARPTSREVIDLLRLAAKHIDNLHDYKITTAQRFEEKRLAASLRTTADQLNQPQDCYHGGCECEQLRAQLESLATR